MFASNRHTPTPSWQTSSPFSASISMPSGPARPQVVDAPRGIRDPGLSLVGEVEIAVGREVQVVQALEALAVGGLEQRLDPSAPRVEYQQPALVVGDEDPPVLVDLEAVRPAVVLDGELPLAPGRDPEHAPEGNVDEPEVAVAIEGRPLQEALDLGPLAVRVGPGRAAPVAELLRHRHEELRLDQLGLLERVEHRGWVRRRREAKG